MIELNVPPLNDRKPDIPLLIDYFIQQLTDQYDGRHLFIDETGIKKMTSYDWKGKPGSKFKVHLPEKYSETPGKPVDAVVVDIPFKESYNANTREVVKG